MHLFCPSHGSACLTLLHLAPTQSWHAIASDPLEILHVQRKASQRSALRLSTKDFVSGSHGRRKRRFARLWTALRAQAQWTIWRWTWTASNDTQDQLCSAQQRVG